MLSAWREGLRLASTDWLQAISSSFLFQRIFVKNLPKKRKREATPTHTAPLAGLIASDVIPEGVEGTRFPHCVAAAGRNYTCADPSGAGFS